LTSVTGVKVQDCNVIDAIEGGLNLQNSTNIVIDNLTVDGTEYGVRAGQGSGTVNTGNTMTISDSNLNAQYPIWLRGDAPGTVIITNSVLEPTEDGPMILDDANGNVNITIDGAAYVTTEEELKEALTDGADTVYVSAGTYTFPTSSISEGDVIVCDENTVFEGLSKLNIKGATVVGATFKNPTGTAVDQTINGTFKNCTFTGANGLRWCYAGETVVFENCVFDGSTYGVHFDGGANYVTFKNCTISGFNAMAAAITKTTFDGCTFVSNGKSNYNGINMWGDTDMINCTFVFDGSCDYEWIDLCSADKTAAFTNCVVNDGTNVSNVSTLIGNKLTKRETSGKIIVDGTELSY
jgi:uncharacterized protein YjbI with pentapeptide repeats